MSQATTNTDEGLERSCRQTGDDGAHAQNLFSRLQHLGLVLLVSLSIPVTSSLFHTLGNVSTSTYGPGNYRLCLGIVTEASSLAVLWYVMSRQNRTRAEIGWLPSILDIPRAIGLFLAITISTWIIWIPVQGLYHGLTGQFLQPKSLDSVFGFGISPLAIAFILLNPFFEELIVRAYTMSEIARIAGSWRLAAVVSVTLQLSYHLYQGFANCLIIAITFAAFAIYYAWSKRIFPIILVHLGYDLFALLTRHF